MLRGAPSQAERSDRKQAVDEMDEPHGSMAGQPKIEMRPHANVKWSDQEK